VLAVWRLARLGRSLKHLIELMAVTESDVPRALFAAIMGRIGRLLAARRPG
jgi:hypothetical protein